MLNFSKTKILSIYFIFFIISFFALLNFINIDVQYLKKKVNLGLDLQGGSYLLLEVDSSSLEKKTLQSKVVPLKKKLREESINFDNFSVSEKIIKFDISQNEIKKFEEIFNQKEGNEINTFLNQYNAFELQNSISKTKVSVSLSKHGIINIRSAAVNQSIEIVRRRIDEIGTKEPSILKRGRNRILVELPGVSDRERIILPITQEEISVSKRIILSGENLIDAQPRFDNLNNQPIVAFSLDRLGAQRFGQITTKNIGKRLAIVLDGEAISAPVIQDSITSGNGTISGNFSFQTATDLALLLRSGALPTPLIVAEERTVGPDLGKDSIKSGIISLIVGFSLVILFMLIKYRFFGYVANISLISNLLMLIGLLTIMEATLTLPGIAGIILTVGMAVDANVLIFERIKEELKEERNNIQAFDMGFKKSIVTILDANITTLIASIILFIFGTGPIKGFAVTLSIGLLTTLFASYFISRHLISIIVFNNREKKISI